MAHTPDGLPLTIGSLPATERDQCLKNAFASIEVRSSKYKALKYMRVKAERKVARAKSVGRLEPNFTVKVEDLQILYRWVEQHRMPQAYVQVFLDSAFAINVLTIFQLIGTWARGLTLEKPVRSQDKPTIFIPISYGTKIGDLVQAPHFEARTRESPLGKVDAYVVPQGGKLILNRDAMLAVLIHQRVGQ